MRRIGLGHVADGMEPWRTELKYDRFLAPGQFGNSSDAHQLRLELSIVTEDSRAKKSLSGTLIVRDQDGQVIYREPYTYEPELSFGSHVHDHLELHYDDGDANHRALRHDLQKQAEFQPERVVYADGEVMTEGFGQTSLMHEAQKKAEREREH